MRRFLLLFAIFAILFATKTSAQFPQDLYADVSLRDKVGQMLMVGVPNFGSPLDTLREDIMNRNLGGILYFGYNIQSPTQIMLLNQELQEFAAIPLMLATDQEGGRVARLRATNGFKDTNSAHQTGAIWNSVDSTRAQAQRMAQWFVEVGLNVNLAPVVDVNVNTSSPAIGRLNRSYSWDPEKVTAHALVFIEAFSEKSIITALKHFPGHGSATTDSHLGFTNITTTWQPYEMDPFTDIIAANSSDMIMPGHLVHWDFDLARPISLSELAVQKLLREEMGYEGVIISDELFMRGVTDMFTLDEIIVNAINSGSDIMLFNTNMCAGPCGKSSATAISLVKYVQDVVEQKVGTGEISQARIDASYARIMALKDERIPSSIGRVGQERPLAITLRQNYPNPFNPSTTIAWELPENMHVRVSVYDVVGREVAVLADGTFASGSHTANWNAANMASGVYIYRIVTAYGAESRTMSLIK